MNKVNILVKGVDVHLLRKQYESVIIGHSALNKLYNADDRENLEGLMNMLEDMLYTGEQELRNSAVKS